MDSKKKYKIPLKKLLLHPIKGYKIKKDIKKRNLSLYKGLQDIDNKQNITKLVELQETLGSKRNNDYYFFIEHENNIIKLLGRDYYNVWLDKQPKYYKDKYCKAILTDNRKLYGRKVPIKKVNNCLKYIEDNAKKSKQFVDVSKVKSKRIIPFSNKKPSSVKSYNVKKSIVSKRNQRRYISI